MSQPPVAQPPVILLTRPAGQSDRFAQALRERFPSVDIVISPLIAPSFPPITLPDRRCSAIIFTSETAVQAAKRIVADGADLPELAFCVGDQTARAARATGFQAQSAQGDASDLIALIQAAAVVGPMLYLHGRDTRGDLPKHLESRGIETYSCLAYAQNEQPLTVAATAVLCAKRPVIAPVFSARSGQILARECARIAAKAPLHVVAISPAAGAVFSQTTVSYAARPDTLAMLAAIAQQLDAPPP